MELHRESGGLQYSPVSLAIFRRLPQASPRLYQSTIKNAFRSSEGVPEVLIPYPVCWIPNFMAIGS